MDGDERVTVVRKPSVEGLGIDLAAQTWQRSGAGGGGGATGDSPQAGAVELAFVEALGQRWVLMRVSGDQSGRVLVYDMYEWECFLDGAKKGEFDDAAG